MIIRRSNSQSKKRSRTNSRQKTSPNTGWNDPAKCKQFMEDYMKENLHKQQQQSDQKPKTQQNGHNINKDQNMLQGFQNYQDQMSLLNESTSVNNSHILDNSQIQQQQQQRQQVRLKDLCLEDKGKIGELIKKLATEKEEKENLQKMLKEKDKHHQDNLKKMQKDTRKLVRQNEEFQEKYENQLDIIKNLYRQSQNQSNLNIQPQQNDNSLQMQFQKYQQYNDDNNKSDLHNNQHSQSPIQDPIMIQDMNQNTLHPQQQYSENHQNDSYTQQQYQYQQQQKIDQSEQYGQEESNHNIYQQQQQQQQDSVYHNASLQSYQSPVENVDPYSQQQQENQPINYQQESTSEDEEHEDKLAKKWFDIQKKSQEEQELYEQQKQIQQQQFQQQENDKEQFSSEQQRQQKEIEDKIIEKRKKLRQNDDSFNELSGKIVRKQDILDKSPQYRNNNLPVQENKQKFIDLKSDQKLENNEQKYSNKPYYQQNQHSLNEVSFNVTQSPFKTFDLSNTLQQSELNNKPNSQQQLQQIPEQQQHEEETEREQNNNDKQNIHQYQQQQQQQQAKFRSNQSQKSELDLEIEKNMQKLKELGIYQSEDELGQSELTASLGQKSQELLQKSLTRNIQSEKDRLKEEIENKIQSLEILEKSQQILSSDKKYVKQLLNNSSGELTLSQLKEQLLKQQNIVDTPEKNSIGDLQDLDSTERREINSSEKLEKAKTEQKERIQELRQKVCEQIEFLQSKRSEKSEKKSSSQGFNDQQMEQIIHDYQVQEQKQKIAQGITSNGQNSGSSRDYMQMKHFSFDNSNNSIQQQQLQQQQQQQIKENGQQYQQQRKAQDDNKQFAQQLSDLFDSSIKQKYKNKTLSPKEQKQIQLDQQYVQYMQSQQNQPQNLTQNQNQYQQQQFKQQQQPQEQEDLAGGIEDDFYDENLFNLVDNLEQEEQQSQIDNSQYTNNTYSISNRKPNLNTNNYNYYADNVSSSGNVLNSYNYQNGYGNNKYSLNNQQGQNSLVKQQQDSSFDINLTSQRSHNFYNNSINNNNNLNTINSSGQKKENDKYNMDKLQQMIFNNSQSHNNAYI